MPIFDSQRQGHMYLFQGHPLRFVVAEPVRHLEALGGMLRLPLRGRGRRGDTVVGWSSLELGDRSIMVGCLTASFLAGSVHPQKGTPCVDRQRAAHNTDVFKVVNSAFVSVVPPA